MRGWLLLAGLLMWGCSGGGTAESESEPTCRTTESDSDPSSSLARIPTPIGTAVEIVPRASWSARDPMPDRMREHGRAIEHVTVHHTASVNREGKDEVATMRSVQRFHQGAERGWGDLAYHYLIGPSGTIYEGRDPAYAADTSTSYDPAGHLTICLMGNFEEEEPSEEARSALVRLAVELLASHDLPPEALTTHRRVAATACPGANLEAWLTGEGAARIRVALSHRTRASALERGVIAR